FPAEDLADARDGNSGDLLRNAAVGRCGEEQLVLVPAMQRQCQRILATGSGDRFGVHHGTGATLLADMAEVGRESVADVDHRRGQLLLAQELSDRNAWLRIEMLQV